MSASNGVQVEDALTLLAEFFGIQFRVRDGAGIDGKPANDGAPLAKNGNRSGVRELPGGAVEMTIQLGSIVGGDVVVSGRSRGSSAELLKCLPSMAVKYLATHRQIQKQQSNLDDYAAYVSQHLEELTWLRAMAQHLELCAIGQRLEDVASRFLPALQEMIRARELLLIRPRTEEADADSECVITLRCGKSTVGDDVCLRLFDRLRQEGVDGPLVKNDLASDAEYRDWADSNPCLLVSVGNAQQRVGWLLALGRSIWPGSLVHGAYRVGTASEREFGTVEASLLSTAAVMLATHARNLALVQAKEELFISIIQCLVNAFDIKDEYSRGHSQRVAQMAVRIGKEMKLSPEDCRRLYISGLLHDLGNLGIPDEILQKAGKLDEREAAIMRSHTRIGHDLIQQVAQIRDVLPAVLHHHETIDGRGYPDGLKGETIPLDARILAVVEAYDGMTSDRPHRPAMASEQAEQVLKSGAGAQWDRRVVEACFRAIDDIRRIAEEGRQAGADLQLCATAVEDAWLPAPLLSGDAATSGV